ncbi:hypothetical protein ILUMI_18195, partial [Ignelater luminosus]
INYYKLIFLKVKEEFVQAIEQEIVNQALNEAGLVEFWEAFKEIFLKVAEQVCGKSKMNKRRKKRTKWWNNEVKRKINLKKERYKEQKRVARNTVKEAREQPWEKFGRKIQSNSEQNQKLFY